MPRAHRLSGFIALALGLSWSPAFADDARLTAVAFAPLPEGSSYSVVTYDDSDRILALREVLAQSLRERGLTVAAPGQKAALRLTLDLKEEDWSVPDAGPGPLRLQGSGGSSSDERVGAQVMVYSGEGRSLLGGRAADRAAGRLVLVELAVTDAETGRRLWQGSARVSNATSGTQDVATTVLPQLLDHLGETIRDHGAVPVRPSAGPDQPVAAPPAPP